MTWRRRPLALTLLIPRYYNTYYCWNRPDNRLLYWQVHAHADVHGCVHDVAFTHTVLRPLSPHVQPIAAGHSREGRVQWHTVGQQAASPSAPGPYPECTPAPVPSGAAATRGSAATPALSGETLQGPQVAQTQQEMHTNSGTDSALGV